MKKRVVSLLLALVMLTSLVPTTVWAEDAYSVAPDTEMQDIRQERDNEGEQKDDPALAGQPMLSTVMPAAVTLTGSGTKDDPYQIGSAEDFAAITWQNSSGYFKLTDNITVTKPCDATFKGTFDGDGHTVTLQLDVTSGNAGLFAKTGSGAVIKNVIVDANVTSSVYSYTSQYYGVAGLVGYVDGKTTIDHCGVTGTIKGTSTSSSYAAYMGGLIGVISDKCEITNSYVSATVENANKYNGSYTGGFLGRTSSNYTLSVTDCYASGDVTAAGGRAGGFTGYVYCSNSNRHTYKNCYAAGTVTASAGNGFGFAYSYASTGYSFTNCYYNNTANSEGCNQKDTTITGRRIRKMQRTSMAAIPF